MVFFTYLRRELVNRKRQTFIVSFGLALAIVVVLVVSSLSNGAKEAQSQVLGSLYGIGTDITVTQTAAPPQPGQGGGRQQFDVQGGQSGSATEGQQRQISRTNLRIARGSGTLDATAVASITAVPDAASVATALRLDNTSFSGELPQVNQGQGAGASGSRAQGQTAPTAPPTLGDSTFSVDSFSVMGIGADEATGPLTGTVLDSGRALGAADSGSFNAVLDATYASSAGLAVGDTITLGKTDGTQDFTIVGIISSGTAAAETAVNVYIPLDTAQTLAGQAGLVTNVYVAASSGASTSSVAEEIRSAIPGATVSTTSDLGSTVSGSLSDASDLLGNLGRWLSILVLVLAFLIAVLFTMSGVGRRTREFGTLRALGWRKNRIVRQVASESILQGVLGGGIGLLLGFIIVRVIDAIAPSLEATTGGLSAGFPGGFPGAGGPGGGGRTGSTIAGAAGGAGQGSPRLPGQTATVFKVPFKAVMTPGVVVAAIGLAILGGVIAGAFGGLRASRLRPADALRSVA